MLKSYFFLFFSLLALCVNGNIDPKDLKVPECKFIENKGQLINDKGAPVPFVLFKSSAPGIDYFITTSGITYVFSKPNEYDEENGQHSEEDFISERSKDKHEAIIFQKEKIELLLQDANIQAANIIKEGGSTFHYNFFFAHCPKGIYDVKEYEEVTIREIYPGIDWVLYGNSSNGVKYDFVVHPGADVSRIKLLYRSAKAARLGTDGQIALRTALGELTENAPLSYVKNDGRKIRSAFKLIRTEKHSKFSESLFQFEGDFKQYNEQTVIIDPQLVWATFFGGNNFEGPMAIETDANGNIFTCGYTYSTNYPVMNAGTFFQGSGTSSLFIMKFTNTGALSWSTYYGDNCPYYSQRGLAVDKFGNVFVGGETYSNAFPVQNVGGYFQATSNAGDSFILKFTNNGTRLWATLFGGYGSDVINSIDTDTLGNLYVGGCTNSTIFPLVNGGGYYQPTNFVATASVGILAKFDTGCNLVWSTYFGSQRSIVYAVNCDKKNNLYITGITSGVGVPILYPGGGAYFQAGFTPTNMVTCFISKFSPQTNLVWSTQYGGSFNQAGYSIVSDTTGNVFVGGNSTSGNFPLQNNTGAYFQGYSGIGAGPFILKFNSSGVRQWATFCGGNVMGTFDSYDNLAIDRCSQEVYLTFSTNTRSLTVQQSCYGGYLQTAMLPAPPANPPDDIAILKFSNSGALLWSTYLGGNGQDFRSSIVCDKFSNLYVTGEWNPASAPAYPLVNPGGGAYYDNTFNGIEDGYIAKFMPSAAIPTLSYLSPICNNTSTVGPLFISPGASGTFSGSAGLNIDPVTGIINCGTTPPGTYTVTLISQGCICFSPSPPKSVVVIGNSPSVNISSSSGSVCSGQSVSLTAITPSTANLTYGWMPGPFGGASITISPAVSSVYTLSVIDVNSGCTNTSTVSITVAQNPVVSISGPSSICEAYSPFLSANGTGTFVWSNGQTGSICIITPTVSSVYSVISTAVNGCTAQAIHSLTVIPSPTLNVIGTTLVCKGEITTLTATSTGSLAWSNGATSNIFSAFFSQSTLITVTATAANGCQRSMKISVVIDACVGISGPGGIYGLLCVYPNPSSGEISIQSKVPIDLLLEDETGRLIQKIQINKELNTINLKLPSGLYFLNGVINERKVSEKIVVEK
jgi:hypothetical protein